jgi:hypothetical protein
MGVCATALRSGVRRYDVIADPPLVGVEKEMLKFEDSIPITLIVGIPGVVRGVAFTTSEEIPNPAALEAIA